MCSHVRFFVVEAGCNPLSSIGWKPVGPGVTESSYSFGNSDAIEDMASGLPGSFACKPVCSSGCEPAGVVGEQMSPKPKPSSKTASMILGEQMSSKPKDASKRASMILRLAGTDERRLPEKTGSMVLVMRMMVVRT